jgi:O-antigen/teichoic acid export membrane protein
MNTAQRIVKNAGFLIISNIFSYFLYMWAVMIMASYLSPHDYGVITLGFSFNGIVTLYLLQTFDKEDKLILNQFLKLSKSSK